MKKYILLGKHKTQSNYRAMNSYTVHQVPHLRHACKLTAEDANKFIDLEARKYTEWKFKLQEI